MRVLAVLTVAFVAATSAPTAGAATSKSYRPPYMLGPAGGDDYNVVYRDEASGRMVVGRGFPGVSPVVGCYPEPSGGWATFRVAHRTARARAFSVVLTMDAVADPYSWVSIGVRTKRGWLGSAKLQGPLAGAERMTLRLNRAPKAGEIVTIEFGVQLGDACPQVAGAAATFPSVTVRS